MTRPDVCLPIMNVACALGCNQETVWHRLYSEPESGLTPSDQYISDGTEAPVGRVPTGADEPEPLPEIPPGLSDFACRNNRLALKILDPIEQAVKQHIDATDPGSFGIVVGTSTSGVEEAADAIRNWKTDGAMTDAFHYHQMEMGGLAEFLGRYLDVDGVRYTITTSCSSSAKVFAAAQALIENGVCDTVLTGGVDALTKLTLNGFYSLQLISSNQCNPFSVNRDGINIGEGGALFLMNEGTDGPMLLGSGESSDAYQMNAPDPEGDGAYLSMSHALDEAGITPEQVDYLNLHGTGTNQNDAMEAKAVDRVFDRSVPCSSTKPFTGHTLGGAGAVEAAICWMMINRHWHELPLPPHLWDGEPDEELPHLDLVGTGEKVPVSNPVVMSNSFAFGGNNCSIIFGDPSDV